MSRGDGGIGKADPWPDNDTPIAGEASPHIHDGYSNRLPLGGHYEGGADYWLDCLIYPERMILSDAQVSPADIRSRQFVVSEAMITGRKNGPTD